MLHLNIKPQNRNRVAIIFLLGGIWGVLDMRSFKGLIPFLIDGAIILVATVIMGNITRYILDKLGISTVRNKENATNILDVEIEELSEQQIEDRKDVDVLNYAILWALLVIILSLF